MLKISDIRIENLSPGGFDHGSEIDNKVHCKITPYIILAQARVGNYEITCNEQHLILNEGEAFFTPPDAHMRIVHHVNNSNSLMSARWLHFNASILGVGIASLFDLPLRVDWKICTKIEPDLDRLFNLNGNKSVVGIMEKNEIGYRIVRQLLSIAKPKPNLDELFNSSDRLKAATGYIKNNMNRRITVHELAKFCAMSPPALFRYFSRSLKSTPQKFIMRIKMEHAADLLRDSELSIAEIADATGFTNQFHFSRCFKLHYGTAPSAYRNTSIWDFAKMS